MILIGAGGHAEDIAATTPGDLAWHHRYDHHSEVPMPRPGGAYVIGINDPKVRAAVADELGIVDCNWVHPNAFVGPRCAIGDGTHVNYGVTMTRTKIGGHCTISPGATICGDVTIGDRVFVGAGAVIRNLVTIGSDAFICMGSIVTRDVAPGEKYR